MITTLALVIVAFTLGVVTPPVWTSLRRSIRKRRVTRELRRIQREQTF